MAETRAEQVAFGWAGQGSSEAREVRPSITPPPRGGYAPGERNDGSRDDELWDVHAAARFLKRSVSWVYHRAEDGTLPVKRIGGRGLRFIPAELRAWVDASGGSRR